MSDHQVSQDELKREFTNEDKYFRELDEKRMAAAKQRDQVRKMVCRREGMPESGCQLEAVEIDGVHVDRCPTCQGVWLDAHELEDLRRANKKPGLLDSFLNILVPGRNAD